VLDGVLVPSGSEAEGVVDGLGLSPRSAPPEGHWKPDMGPVGAGAGAGALICVGGAAMGLGVSVGTLGAASSAGGDAAGALGERVSLVGIGAKIPDTETLMSGGGAAGYWEGSETSEDAAGVCDGTGIEP
jgi:hypothetical protein